MFRDRLTKLVLFVEGGRGRLGWQYPGEIKDCLYVFDILFGGKVGLAVNCPNISGRNDIFYSPYQLVCVYSPSQWFVSTIGLCLHMCMMNYFYNDYGSWNTDRLRLNLWPNLLVSKSIF